MMTDMAITADEITRTMQGLAPQYRARVTWTASRATSKAVRQLEHRLAAMIVRRFKAGADLSSLNRQFGRARVEAAIRAAVRKI